MSIKIKQKDDKFLVKVEECFEFDNPEDAKKCIDALFNFKVKHGKVTGFKHPEPIMTKNKVKERGKKRS